MYSTSMDLALFIVDAWHSRQSANAASGGALFEFRHKQSHAAVATVHK